MKATATISSTASARPSIKGLFEIHITVDHQKPGALFALHAFVSRYDTMKKVLAVTEAGNDQYMISKWKNGTIDEAIAKAKEIEAAMIRDDLKVLRVKVESMAGNPGVPATRAEALKGEQYYFEFHAKLIVPKSIDTLNGQLGIMRFLIPQGARIGYSVNIAGSAIPLLTIRVNNTGREEAFAIKDTVIDLLKDSQYHIKGGIQQEFAIFDTNPSMDDDWLYTMNKAL